MHEPRIRFLVVEGVAVLDAHLAVGSPSEMDDAVLVLGHFLEAGVKVLEIEALIVVGLADESAAVVVAVVSHS